MPAPGAGRWRSLVAVLAAVAPATLLPAVASPALLAAIAPATLLAAVATAALLAAIASATLLVAAAAALWGATPRQLHRAMALSRAPAEGQAQAVLLPGLDAPWGHHSRHRPEVRHSRRRHHRRRLHSSKPLHVGSTIPCPSTAQIMTCSASDRPRLQRPVTGKWCWMPSLLRQLQPVLTCTVHAACAFKPDSCVWQGSSP